MDYSAVWGRDHQYSARAAAAKRKPQAPGGLRLGLYRQSSICVARLRTSRRLRPSPRSRTRRTDSGADREGCRGADRRATGASACRSSDTAGSSSVRRHAVSTRVFLTCTLQAPSGPYSYARLKFKRMFETGASRKKGVLVISSTGCGTAVSPS